jgi:eukaryotic-like serine/threonine-protein kinase
MYAKRFPWDAALTIDAVMQHINKPPIELTTLLPNIDKQIAAAIMKGLEADPDRRWQKVPDMVAEIREAEARMVQAARKAAAAKNPGKIATGTVTSEKSAAESRSGAMPQASTGNASIEAAAGKPTSSRKAPVKKKKRASDDDVDLNEMFGD